MAEEQKVSGGITVHSRTVLFTFTSGPEKVTYLYAAATYSGDFDGPAGETFVAVEHADGSQTHYGFGTFTGTAKGRPGTLLWKFKGIPGGGDMEIFDGSGEIKDLRGSISYRMQEGSSDVFTYDGSVA